MLTVSFCYDVRHSKNVDEQQVFHSFFDLIEELREDFVPAKFKEDLPLFSPAEYAHEGVRRCNANVLRLGFLVIDLDKGTEADLEAPFSIIGTYGHFVYSSFSHDPKGQNKFRVIVKLSRPVEVAEWASFWIRAMVYFGLHKFADDKCSDPARIYYVPGGDKTKYICLGEDGRALDVEAILQLLLPAGISEPAIENYQEVLDEEDRGEITLALKDHWEAKLSNLTDAIRTRPYPGELYDLKNNEVYSIARGIPHIIDGGRVERMVFRALKARYDAATRQGYDTQAHAMESERQVQKAIGEGRSKPWYPLKIDDIDTRPLTEVGLAERLLDHHSSDLSWVTDWEKWSVWTGKFWDVTKGNELAHRRMKDTIRLIPDEAAAFVSDRQLAEEHYQSVKDDPNVSPLTKGLAKDAFEALENQIANLYKFATKSETNGKITAGTKIASREESVLTTSDRFDRDLYLLNFQNGTLDLRTLQFTPHRRNNFITKIIPYDYDPNAKCERFDQFLDECMLGRKRLVKFLWRLAGYSTLGITTEQILILCIGDGANGKSTFLNVLMEALGKGANGYAFPANSENLLTTKGGSRHETWRMSLFAKRLVVCQEVDEGRNFNESLIKELTGSDGITGRKMRQDEWSFEPTHQLWLAANHLPHIRGTDEGIWRRLVVIPWDASFRNRADPRLPLKLKQETPGILVRMVQEAHQYLLEGLTIPREVRVASEHYRREQDPLGPFFEGSCVLGPKEWTKRDILWDGYLRHCETAREQVFRQKKRFYAAVQKRFKTNKRMGIVGFIGLRLKTHEERLAASPEARLQRHDQELRDADAESAKEKKMKLN